MTLIEILETVKLEVNTGGPVERITLVMLRRLLGIVKLGVEIGSPDERITLVMLIRLFRIVRLGTEMGDPVEPVMLVMLKGPTGLMELGVDIGSPVEPMMLVTLKGPIGLMELGVDIGNPVEAIMLGILIEPKGAAGRLEVKFKKGCVRTAPDGGRLVRKLVALESEVEIERLGKETPEVGVEVSGIGVERLNEPVSERLPSADAEKLELGRVGIGGV